MVVGRKGNVLLAGLVEKAFGGEFFAPFLQQRHQRAEAGRLKLLDDDLIGGFAGKGRYFSGGDDFQPFLRLYAQAGENALPDHRVDAGARRP